ncbi:hypothetical protein QU481_05700 [Crenobacter sp. SG2303]|uniref:ESPR domain-containing protein n=1 Tax=Crenobacter oryzisoli TaxID=3056844 RepID=A0ABT7XKR5_9NEIS|nr:hypothetical protein [Crenobacter sp. SG2303]MDN0074387.1 hypothetical protein [Crenobacter sp. SG2303]
MKQRRALNVDLWLLAQAIGALLVTRARFSADGLKAAIGDSITALGSTTGARGVAGPAILRNAGPL